MASIARIWRKQTRQDGKKKKLFWWERVVGTQNRSRLRRLLTAKPSRNIIVRCCCRDSNSLPHCFLCIVGCIAIFPPTTPADPHTPLHSITAPLNTRHLLAGSQSRQIRHHDFCTPQTPEEDRALQRQLLCSMHHRWHHWYLTPLPPKNTRTPTNNHSLRPNAHRRHAS